MRVVVVAGGREAGRFAAEVIAGIVTADPAVNLGLATGQSPLPVYDDLIRRHRQGEVSFAAASAFLLDEYVGLPCGHPASFRSTIRRVFSSHTDLPDQRVFGPQLFGPQVFGPTAGSGGLQAACDRYEQSIRDAGGIAVQLLGIGSNGHIGFNEPPSEFGSRTRPVRLAAQTRQDNARSFAAPEEVPTGALTQGIATILEADKLVLVALGAQKAQAVAAAVDGPVTEMCPASALQLHADATMVVDREAAALLSAGE